MSTVPCQYHFRPGGFCVRGNDCRFSHSDPSDNEPKQVQVCPHYSRGTCKFGNHCRLSHSEVWQAEPSSTISHLNGAPTAFKAFGPCKFFTQGKCIKGTACPFPHTITPPPSLVATNDQARDPSFEPCRFFAQGRCTKGSLCPFFHAQTSDFASTQIPCHFFLKGVCKNGDSCTFFHDSVPPGLQIVPATADTEWPPSEQHNSSSINHTEWQQENGALDDEPFDRQMFSCKVTFGHGATIQSITTPFESRSILLSNLPSPVTEFELCDLLEPFGDPKSIVIDDTSDTACVKFSSTSQASAAVRGLHKTQFNSRHLLAKLDLKTVESGDATLRSTKVKISWYTPGRVAWAHYGTKAYAKKQAENLNGASFHGKLVTAAFQTPASRQRNSFSVEIKGLPAQVDIQSFKGFCRAQSVALGDLPYDRQGSIKRVEDLLRDYGALDTFEALPEDTNKPKITVFAQFADPDGAAEAVKHLHNKPQDFLRRTPIWLENIHSVKYSIPSPQFAAIKQSISRLRDNCQDCRLRFYDRDEAGREVDDVCIRIFGTDPRILSRVKMELDKLLRGEQLVDDQGKVVWDEYFITTEGKAFLLETEQQTKAFIKCDPRMRTLYVFGDKSKISLSVQTVLHKVRALEAEKHIISLDREMIKILMRGGLSVVEQLVGPKKLIIDIVARTLTVHSDDADLERVRATLASQLQQPAGDFVTDIACPVCYCEVTDRAQLPCGHFYCKDCLRHLLQAAAGSTLPSLKCVHEMGDHACDWPIPNTLIRALLPPEEETRLYEALFLAYIHSRPSEFKYCPTPDCTVIYHPAEALLRCPSCFDRICASCHVQFHEGLTCDEYRDAVSGGNNAFLKWKQENGVRACPGCQANLQKNGGCNHIHCSQCGTHICWVCMKTFGDADHEGGVYNHMRKAHGDIGI